MQCELNGALAFVPQSFQVRKWEFLSHPWAPLLPLKMNKHPQLHDVCLMLDYIINSCSLKFTTRTWEKAGLKVFAQATEMRWVIREKAFMTVSFNHFYSSIFHGNTQRWEKTWQEIKYNIWFVQGSLENTEFEWKVVRRNVQKYIWDVWRC